MSTDAGHPSKAKPRRRRFQYRLRTLLVLMLAVGCGFGWLAYKMNRARRQREAATAIRELGGRVEYRAVSGGMIGTAMTWLGKLFGEDLTRDVTAVHLERTRVSDAALVHLQGLTELQQLFLHNTQVSDVGLVHLWGLTKLESLSLNETQVSDVGVNELRKALPNVHVSLTGKAKG